MKDKELEEFLKKDPVEALEIPVRVMNILEKLKHHEAIPPFLSGRNLPPIKTIGDLLQWSESELSIIKKLGRKSRKDIKDALAVHGLFLKENTKLVPRSPAPPMPLVNIMEPVSQIIRILSPFSPSVRVRIVRALRAIVGD